MALKDKNSVIKTSNDLYNRTNLKTKKWNTEN